MHNRRRSWGLQGLINRPHSNIMCYFISVKFIERRKLWLHTPCDASLLDLYFKTGCQGCQEPLATVPERFFGGFVGGFVPEHSCNVLRPTVVEVKPMSNVCTTPNTPANIPDKHRAAARSAVWTALLHVQGCKGLYYHG